MYIYHWIISGINIVKQYKNADLGLSVILTHILQIKTQSLWHRQLTRAVKSLTLFLTKWSSLEKNFKAWRRNLLKQAFSQNLLNLNHPVAHPILLHKTHAKEAEVDHFEVEDHEAEAEAFTIEVVVDREVVISRIKIVLRLESKTMTQLPLLIR